MASLPFALALSDDYGRMTYIATFREFADLWTFWTAWTPEVEQPTNISARFVHTGRMVSTTRPTTEAAALTWANDSRRL